MKISTKGRYALRMMLDLAEHQQDGFVALKDIAARQNISKKYLEQIVPILNKSNFLQANRGFQGGYRLVNAPREYTVGSILRLTEGNLTPVACLDFNPVGCERRNECITLPLWQGLNRLLRITWITSLCRIFLTITKRAALIIIPFDANRRFHKAGGFFLSK